jgi:hypothetical protein
MAYHQIVPKSEEDNFLKGGCFFLLLLFGSLGAIALFIYLYQLL